jgi:hypothetical protein
MNHGLNHGLFGSGVSSIMSGEWNGSWLDGRIWANKFRLSLRY